jgi:hypothetical protein
MAVGRFRPEFDAVAPREPWTLDPSERERLARLQAEAGQAAAARLQGLFGRASALFGAQDLAQRIGQTAIEPAKAFDLAVTIATLDYFAVRAVPPRPDDSRRWRRLRAHLLARLGDCLEGEAPDAVVWRCILGRVPGVWIPIPVLERSIAAAAARIPTFRSVTVELDIPLDPPGGLLWLGRQSRRAIDRLSASLGRGKPAVVELIRDAETPPASAELVIAFAMDEGEDGALRFRCWDPAAGRARTLAVLTPDGSGGSSEPGPLVAEDEETAPDRPTVKAVRLWELPPAVPPLFGARRYLFWLLPWRVFWWIRRWIALRCRRPAQREAGLRR